jgi:hypothetical protein
MTDEELRAMIDEFDRDGDGESKFMCIDIYKQAIFLCVRYFRIVFPFLLDHLANGNVSFCHHLESVVCRPFTFHLLIFFSETP